MEEYKLATRVRKNLNDYGIPEQLSKSTIENLIKVERYFLECEKELDKTVEKIRNINITVRGISKATGIGKSTIYNNPTTLKIYIEKRQGLIAKIDVFSRKRVEKLEKKIQELTTFLERIKINIINHHLLENQIEVLKEENEQLERKNEFLSSERTELVLQINEFEKQLQTLRKKDGNVLKL